MLSSSTLIGIVLAGAVLDADMLVAHVSGKNSNRSVEALLPRTTLGPAAPIQPGLDFGRSYLSAAHDFVYGGDLVDVFHTANGHTSVVVLDISGHGIDAAMHAGLVKHALRAFMSIGLNAVAAVRALNHLCIENSLFEHEDDFFATLFFGVIGRDRREMQSVSAGHEAGFRVSEDGVLALRATGPVIGLMDDAGAFEAVTIALCPGDIIVAATDGFSESRDTLNVFLGSEALGGLVATNRSLSAQAQAERITDRAFQYAGRRLRDDVASLVVKILAT